MEKNVNILDYLSKNTLEIILDTYGSNFPDICLAINDLDEHIVVARNFHPICSEFHRKNAGTEQLCLDCNKYITQHLHENKYIEYKCGNGLVDIAFPITFHEKHIGTFYIGQIFIAGDETPMSFFEQHAEKYNFDKTEYLKTAKTIKTLTRKEVDKLVADIKDEIMDLLTL